MFTLINIIDKQYQNIISPQFKEGIFSDVQPMKTKEIPSDTIEIQSKTKKESKKDTFSIAAVLTTLAILGVLGAKKIHTHYKNNLPCGIKRGEFREEFFNFIKKNDPECSYFKDKKDLLQLEKDMDEEKFLILKKLYRMTAEKPLKFYSKQNDTKRFTFKELSDFLKITDSENIQFLEQLTLKQHKDEYGNITKLRPEEIKRVLLEINNENKCVAKEVIDKYEISSSPTKLNELLMCFKNINNDNAQIYKLLFACRKNGQNTNLTYKDMKNLSRIIKENNNPKTAELLLNIKKETGTGEFAYGIDKIETILKVAKDENIDLYNKLFNDVGVKELKDDFSTLVKGINSENIDNVLRFANLKTKNSEFVFYNTSEIIEIANITSKFNTEQHSVLNDVINGYEIDSSHRSYIKTIIKTIADESRLPRVRDVIAKTNSLSDLHYKLKYPQYDFI